MRVGKYSARIGRVNHIPPGTSAKLESDFHFFKFFSQVVTRE